MTPSRLAAVALALTIPMGLPAPLAAQDGAGSSPPVSLDPTIPTTIPTTVPPAAPVPVDGPAPASTTVAPTPFPTTTSTVVDPVAETDAPAEEEPPVDVTVPPPPQPAGPLSEEAVAAARARQESRVVFRNLPGARRLAEEAERNEALAQLHVGDLRARIAGLQQRLGTARRSHRTAAARMAKAKETLSERAVWAYVRGPLHEMTSVLDAKDPNDMYRRRTMVQSVLDADQEALEEYREARDALSAGVVGITDEIIAAERELAAAEEHLWQAARRAQDATYELAIVSAGSSIVIHGFVFPVADPHSFVDTFLAPRMPGTEYEHLHQGTDIFAPAGTELLACERGVITKMGHDVLGGIKLWVVGESGARYYYAHLSAFAEGVHDGQVVEAGTVVGYVGNTGNAVGTPSHLHFEIHPRGGPAINPYPLLKAVDDLG